MRQRDWPKNGAVTNERGESEMQR